MWITPSSESEYTVIPEIFSREDNKPSIDQVAKSIHHSTSDVSLDYNRDPLRHFKVRFLCVYSTSAYVMLNLQPQEGQADQSVQDARIEWICRRRQGVQPLVDIITARPPLPVLL